MSEGAFLVRLWFARVGRPRGWGGVSLWSCFLLYSLEALACTVELLRVRSPGASLAKAGPSSAK